MRSQGIGVALEQLGPGGEGRLRAVVAEVLGAQVRGHGGLGIHDQPLLPGQLHDHVRTVRAVLGLHMDLLLEVDVAQHPRGLHHATQLDLAPGAAGGVGAQRSRQRSRDSLQLGVRFPSLLERAGDLPELLGAILLEPGHVLLDPAQPIGQRSQSGEDVLVLGGALLQRGHPLGLQSGALLRCGKPALQLGVVLTHALELPGVRSTGRTTGGQQPAHGQPGHRACDEEQQGEDDAEGGGLFHATQILSPLRQHSGAPSSDGAPLCRKASAGQRLHSQPSESKSGAYTSVPEESVTSRISDPETFSPGPISSGRDSPVSRHM